MGALPGQALGDEYAAPTAGGWVDNDGTTADYPEAEATVSEVSNPGPDDDLPDWAIGQAMSQLVDADGLAIEERARQLVQDFNAERHGEGDDPDQGGEG